MPNWAEGVLKIRGTRKDIRSFLTGALEPIPDVSQQIASFMGRKFEQPEVEIHEDEWDFNMKSPNGLYIKGTRRAFIESDIVWDFGDRHEEILIIDSFKQAWGVDTEPFAILSKQYGIDIKIYVFERGMEFNQDIEIRKGKILKDNEIKFGDYEWECLMPNLGG
ncbi:hypothetical protein RVS70_09305 [Virgibacillus sp. M23]|uniref:hypothetical protein n=1 Tax=Virgibacillus sp. M23 TaxID=3079030 RepID=UPI002A91622E|nr:hypothetical protein [Virgibacillus sp. M23]MDY7044401.1 hypothetical protein [Virgibacillus sp. M23]